MKNKRTIIKITVFLIVALLFTTLSGSDKIDSLKTVIETADHDTTKIKALNKLGWSLMYSNPDTAIILGKQALDLSEKTKDEKRKANTLSNLGAYHYIKSDYTTALDYYHKSLEIRKSLSDKKGIAVSYNNIGTIYANQSSYPEALEYYFKSLKIQKQLGDKKGTAATYNNIGVIYMNQSSYPQALGYYFKALKTKKEINDTINIHYANMLGNIGNIYNYQSSNPQALEYYFKALKIFKQLGDKKSIAASYTGIGNIYVNQSSYPQALEYYFESLKIQEQLGDKKGMANSYDNIANFYVSVYDCDSSKNGLDFSYRGVNTNINHHALLDSAVVLEKKSLAIDKVLSDEYHMTFTLAGMGDICSRKGNYKEGIEHYKKAALLADSIGALYIGSNAHSGLAECYEQLGSYKLALKHYKQYATLKDTVFNEEKSKEIGKLEARHEMEMAEIKRIQEEEEQTRILEQQTQRRHLLQYSGIIMFIIAVFATLLFSGRLNIPVRLAKSGVFFTFLLVFEFVLVLIDPYIEQWTGGEPAYNLAVNVALAGLFLPLHNIAVRKLEQRLFKTRKKKLE